MTTNNNSVLSKTENIKPLNIANIEGRYSGFEFLENGGVASAKGFRASGVHAGFRKNPTRLDYALVVPDEPCACAGVFTQNVFCAAPVVVSKQHLGGVGYGTASVVAINSGIANAATGQLGLNVAKQSAEIISGAIGCTADEVMLASTGIIGQHLQLEPFKTGTAQALDKLSCTGGTDAATAIMTTDTHPKQCAVSFSGNCLGIPNATFTVGGMAKGSGMIMPNMATMISVITTDAPVQADALHKALKHAVGVSFNKVTVDSDTSTNDTCFLLASGKATARAEQIKIGTEAFNAFQDALCCVCINLAKQMASDGEGATRLVTVNVSGAQSASDADVAARAVANSPLVKTAIYGRDANWGRIAGALGKSGAKFAQEDVAIDIMGIPVCRQGLTVPFSESEALARFEEHEVVISVDLGAGSECTTMWTCDFSHEYVSINGDYRS